MDLYADLAKYYDLENAELVDDIAFYAMLAEQKRGSILDVGCGTGRVTFNLARLGYHVVGIDDSPAMLVHAQRKLEMHKSNVGQVTLHQCDVRQLALNEQFSLVIMAYNGFMHLTHQTDQLAALNSIRQHMTADALLVLDIGNPIPAFASRDDSSLVLERTLRDPTTGETIMQQSVSILERTSQLMDITWVYDRIAADGRITRTLVPLVLRYTFPIEMDLLLKQAGLTLQEIYGDYDEEPFQEDSPRMLVVATATHD